MARNVSLVGNLDREQHAGCWRFEDGGNAGRRASDEQHEPGAFTEHPWQTIAKRLPDGGTGDHGWAFHAHCTATTVVAKLATSLGINVLPSAPVPEWNEAT